MTRVEAMALAIWQQREKQFPERVRRMQPDAMDHASGAWSRCLADALAALAAIRTVSPGVLAAAAPAVSPASMDDYAVAAEAAALLPTVDHPDVGDILAELARDWRTMVDATIAEHEAAR